MKDIILIATIKDWNINNFYEFKNKFEDKYNLYLITNKDDLIYQNVKDLNPKYIFFPHWSWLIPNEIYENYECILFHMTDLPYGRGGSPLQNLITNKIYNTKISAIKVTKELDEGDIYLKEDFDISKGSAKEIYENASNLIFKKLIPNIIKKNIVPKKQEGDIVLFKRRTPEQSNIKTLNDISINNLYDFIRMLDAPSYPKAYLELDNLKIELSEVIIKDGKLEGRFEVSKDE
ncbi:methionyl-tRNA formyltransferase [Arcobacter cryaerophilus gv. pseudocryaerophilus]|uniref:Methionyl-tRNA formyltransferase n=3 Tax=unclassified Arcobacter TaxID=2593671 RepID=A0AA96RCF3_9BACT|nr:methionyl-tRNA formyltransferase [Arcobacter sp. AZ-2023]WPD06027.1 methionyl-tRNA formyltransferase [Arcobacter sp. DSM 115956]WPD08119.1 methionyl-tRNA formyltransferase [Arcobacter sp. DSM 115955]WNL32384.1 methionyl-tRNA formyltransferase [Arcobacter sp. AZ-2023]WNP38534.1 methionyl-tRNA formyltransferase [Arcobacter sp. AZ-2023]